MPSPSDIATAYIATWNEADDGARLKLIDDWAPDALYRDPLMQSQGRAGISAMIADARSHFPGHSFELAGTPDGHGPFVRFSWRLSPTGKTPVAGGTDVVRLDAEGRIAEVIGFLDAVNP